MKLFWEKQVLLPFKPLFPLLISPLGTQTGEINTHTHTQKLLTSLGGDVAVWEKNGFFVWLLLVSFNEGTQKLTFFLTRAKNLKALSPSFYKQKKIIKTRMPQNQMTVRIFPFPLLEKRRQEKESKHRSMSLNIYLNRNSKPLHPLTFQRKTMTN